MLKKLLSYFNEFPLEQSESKINPHLSLTYHHGNYKLSTPRAIYSYGTKYHIFSEAFRLLKIEDFNIQQVLMFGFGMGSIPVILARNKKKYHFTGVEIDPVIINWAKKYLPDEILKNIDLIGADAEDFVYNFSKFSKAVQVEKFDLIAIDLFVDDEVPEKFEKKEFLKKLSGFLNDNGIILYNRFADNRFQSKKTEDYFNDIFKVVFSDAKMLKINLNRMLVNR